LTGTSTPAATLAPLTIEHLGMASENEFLNVFDAASLLGVHVQTLRKLARQRKIPSFKVGRDWKFRKEALVRWADEQHQASAVPASTPNADDRTDGNVADDRQCSVLVIDDDEKVCKAMRRQLERLECRVREATDGMDGLQLLRQEPPDLILLDLAMPGMNGPQFLEELRKTHPHLPVIIVTGYPDGELMAEAMKHGPLMLLSKPFEAAQVQKLVALLVGGMATVDARTEPEVLVPRSAGG
jgi:excisionase family DNA binding protein